VSWYDAIRFANWLQNGQGSGDTETGAYTLLGGSAVPTNADSIARNAGATWFLPSEDEWYKAAYHKNDGVTGNYFDYPTGSDTPPTLEPPPGGSNSANAQAAGGGPNSAGAYTQSDSPYFTFDQGGNVREWNEAFFGTGFRGVRGGTWSDFATEMRASSRLFLLAGSENIVTGFRVATVVPEPSSIALAACGVVGLIACAGRRKERRGLVAVCRPR
jgi:formylglycine-generating enzyme required for sulfatase activity